MRYVHLLGLFNASHAFVNAIQTSNVINLATALMPCQPVILVQIMDDVPMVLTMIYQLTWQLTTLTIIDHSFDRNVYHSNHYSEQCRVRLVFSPMKQTGSSIKYSFLKGRHTKLSNRNAEIVLFLVPKVYAFAHAQSFVDSLSAYRHAPYNVVLLTYDDKTYQIPEQYLFRRLCPETQPVCLINGSYRQELVNVPIHTWKRWLKRDRNDLHGSRVCFVDGGEDFAWESIQDEMQRATFSELHQYPMLPEFAVALILAKANNFTFDSVATHTSQICMNGELYPFTVMHSWETGRDSIVVATNCAIGFSACYTKEVDTLVAWRLPSVLLPFTAAVWLLLAVLLGSAILLGCTQNSAREPAFMTALAIVAPVGNYHAPSVINRKRNLWYPIWVLTIGFIHGCYRNEMHSIFIKPDIHLTEYSVQQLLELNYTLHVRADLYEEYKMIHNNGYKTSNAGNNSGINPTHMYTMEEALLDSAFILGEETQPEAVARLISSERALYLAKTVHVPSLREIGKAIGFNIMLTKETMFRRQVWWALRNMPNEDVVAETLEQVRMAGFVDYWGNVRKRVNDLVDKTVIEDLRPPGNGPNQTFGSLKESLALESFCVLMYGITVAVFYFAVEFFKAAYLESQQ